MTVKLKQFMTENIKNILRQKYSEKQKVYVYSDPLREKLRRRSRIRQERRTPYRLHKKQTNYDKILDDILD